jgi:glycosyltransferase involved in cell wall biosynthesis
MHIALIISSLETGGAERVLSELANHWVSQGQGVSLITLCAPGTPSLYPLDSRIRGVQLGQTASGSVPVFVRLKNIVRRIFKVRKALKAESPDVIVSFVDVMNITTLIASRWLDIPVIVAERTHPAYHPLPVFYKVLRKIAYLWADKVICQTASASCYFSRLPDSKKAVIPNYVKRVAVPKQEADIAKPVRRLISVGRLCQSKGFDTLIRAFADLVPQNRDLNLLIYGEGVLRPVLESLIRELGLTQHVFLPGTVRNIEAALSQADLFVFPSHYEGFPNALCEAMAAGLPVIASACSGTVDILREGVDGRLFPVGDVNRLGTLLKELVEDPTQRMALSQGALTLPDRFSKARVLKLWDDVLAEVMKRR